jgi:Nucleotide-diphospho-sugar transferase
MKTDSDVNRYLYQQPKFKNIKNYSELCPSEMIKLHNNKRRLNQQQRHQSPLWIAALRWFLSNLICSLIAFHLGTTYGSRKKKCPTLLQQQHLTANHGLLLSEYHADGSLNVTKDEFHCGIRNAFVNRLSRNDFLTTYDMGIPWTRNESGNVYIFHTQQKSFVGNNELTPQEVDRCDVLKVVMTDLTSNKADTENSQANETTTCLAIVDTGGPSPMGDSYHAYKWINDRTKSRRNKRKSNWRPVSRYGGNRAAIQNLPKPITTIEGLRLLHDYLSVYDSVLEELRPIANHVVSKSTTGTIVIMVCNSGHVELLLNYVCAARAVGVDLSNVLLFCTDKASYQIARELLYDVTPYYSEKLFAPVPSSTGEYGSHAYGYNMLAKAYCVHLISALGHDLFFQDVDIVPFRKNYTEKFIDASKSVGNFDIYFQYDHNHSPIYLPWSANTGFYYARSNQKTRFLFSALIRLSDMILRTKSHQAVLTALLSDQVSTFGLRVKVMQEESSNFPGTNAHTCVLTMSNRTVGCNHVPNDFRIFVKMRQQWDSTSTGIVHI